jgi:hypothetical protein
MRDYFEARQCSADYTTSTGWRRRREARIEFLRTTAVGSLDMDGGIQQFTDDGLVDFLGRVFSSGRRFAERPAFP